MKLRAFPTSDVCVDAVLGRPNVHAGLLCPCHSVPCIRKCCKDNEYLHIGPKGKEDLCLPVSAEPRLDQNTSKWRPNLSKVSAKQADLPHESEIKRSHRNAVQLLSCFN